MNHRPASHRKGISGLAAVYLMAAAMTLLTGCSSLLPSSKEETISTWRHFEQVKTAYDKIVPGNSRADLKELGFDLFESPNVLVLNYLDVSAKVQPIPIADLDPGLQECLRARDDCQAYVFDLRQLRGKRVGKFWPDFLNFRRKTDSRGWRFNALLVLVSDRVTYKLWSGTPKIETFKEERNPLGPIQGSGDKVISLLPWY